jgi:Fic family protein
MNSRYVPPYRITPGILNSIEQIGEALGNLRAHSDNAIDPILRRGNRIKTVQASLAIEGNTLSLEQVTAVIAGKRVLAPPREIQEVRNAFAAEESTLMSDQESDYQRGHVWEYLDSSLKCYSLDDIDRL